jgi:hypothetical protein
MSFLSFTSTRTDSILSRRDALLRTLGVALRASFIAWVALVCLRIAGVWIPALLLPLAALGVLAAAALAWRHLSARILPDGVTSLTDRALLGIVVALAACSVAGLVAYELTLHGSLMTLSPYVPILAAQLGGLSVYSWCMQVARRRRLGPIDGDDAAFVVSVAGEVIGAAIDAGSSGD